MDTTDTVVWGIQVGRGRHGAVGLTTTGTTIYDATTLHAAFDDLAAQGELLVIVEQPAHRPGLGLRPAGVLPLAAGRGSRPDAVTTEVLLDYLRSCREASVPGRPLNVVSLLGVRADRYAPSTINHRLAAVSGLFVFRTMRDPAAPNPVPKGREARPTEVERNGLLGHLAARPKQRSALRLREPRRLPRALVRRETSDLLGSLRTWRDRAIAGLMLFSGLRSCEVLSLDVNDVDIGARWLRVTGMGAKECRISLDVDVAGVI